MTISILPLGKYHNITKYRYIAEHYLIQNKHYIKLYVAILHIANYCFLLTAGYIRRSHIYILTLVATIALTNCVTSMQCIAITHNV